MNKLNKNETIVKINKNRTGGMAQWAKMLVTKPDTLGSIPGPTWSESANVHRLPSDFSRNHMVHTHSRCGLSQRDHFKCGEKTGMTRGEGDQLRGKLMAVPVLKLSWRPAERRQSLLRSDQVVLRGNILHY